VVAVFQPNRYSRMEILSPDYADAFVHADVAVVMDVYPSGERPIPGVTGKLVVNAVLDAHPDTQVLYLPRRSEVAPVLAQYLRPGDVCISMGCGDVASLPDEILAVWAR
jgi:UDP-N-acetylmuramate--alanine ligase